LFRLGEFYPCLLKFDLKSIYPALLPVPFAAKPILSGNALRVL
jgi:hypothetical protein